MQAIVQSAYGPAERVLALAEVERPEPAPDEVLVRVEAASVHADVWHVVTGRPLVMRLFGSGLRRPAPVIPGTDFAGVVEAVGSAVSRFRPGDEVFGESHRGMQWKNGGTFAEYVTAPEDVLAAKPKNVSFAEAAAVPTPGMIALFNLQMGKLLRAGAEVLVNGAAGAVGSIVVQMAKAEGARVTAVDHTDKLDLLRSIGADEVVDYTRTDCTEPGPKYDLIFDVASTLSLQGCKRVLAPEGIYVFIGHDHFGKATGAMLGSVPRALGLAFWSLFDKHLPRADLSATIPKRQCMEQLAELLARGALRPVVDRTLPLSEAPAALRLLEGGQLRGRVVLTPQPSR
jgi:NADPH:quinone reductase-like Zn-dependent oxidoreductase